MRKIIVSIIGLMFLAGVSFASVNVLDNGTSKGPAQDINFVGATVTDNGPSKTVSVATMTSYVKPVSVAADPCGTYPAGAIFIKTATGAPCFCNSSGVDLSLYDGATACF